MAVVVMLVPTSTPDSVFRALCLVSWEVRGPLSLAPGDGSLRVCSPEL